LFHNVKGKPNVRAVTNLFSDINVIDKMFGFDGPVDRTRKLAHAITHPLPPVEVWQDEALVGGLYGVALGKVFFGESMFSLARDASKVALCRLVEEIAARGYELIDCQVASAHLSSLGARDLPRASFVSRVAQAIQGMEPDRSWPTPERQPGGSRN
jgi:Leu/Phe-tRNA-protein transferase